MESSHVSLPMLATEVVHRFSPVISTKNVELTNNNSTAVRARNSSNAVILSSMPLQEDDVFEIRLEEVQRQWSGALRFGVTTQVPMSSQSQVQSELKAMVEEPFYDVDVGAFKIAYHRLKMQLRS